jgi:Uncharacterized protein conserved in bacteria (DUF2332)
MIIRWISGVPSKMVKIFAVGAVYAGQVAVLSAGRPVYWISAETRADPAEPRLRLATCVNGTIASQQALARYQSHGAWLEWTAQSPHPRSSAR